MLQVISDATYPRIFTQATFMTKTEGRCTFSTIIIMNRTVLDEKAKLQINLARFVRLTKWAGPFTSVIVTLLIGVAILSISRLALVVWQWDRVHATGLPNGAEKFIRSINHIA